MRYILLLVPVLMLSAAHQYVSRQIASGQIGTPFASSAVTFKPIDPTASDQGFDHQSPTAKPQRAEHRQPERLFNQRMEDMRNYARNPAGWHGAPPF